MQICATTMTLLPEWAPQSGVMLTWPHQQTIWADMLDDIDAVYVQVVKAIAAREQVIITCYDATHRAHIKTLLTQAAVALANVHCYIAPSDDVWVRDHGPITVIQNEAPCMLDFTFNGWGNKYPAAQDNEITRTLAKQHAFGQTPVKTLPLVLEGGGIEVDGHGTLLTTSSCLLSPQRNPHLSKPDIEKQLKQVFGVERILWLDHGYLAGDDTDGHIDTLARFVDPHALCYIRCNDPADEHYDALKCMEAQLATFKDYQGSPYRLIPLPWPRARYAAYDGRRLPATYANFLLINGAVLAPVYDDPADAEALAVLSACFPDRDIIPIDGLPIIQWYGSVHCMTMQLPTGVLP